MKFPCWITANRTYKQIRKLVAGTLNNLSQLGATCHYCCQLAIVFAKNEHCSGRENSRN